MDKAKRRTGIALATAAAGLFAAVTVPAIAGSKSEGMVKCTGVNACKGMSDCKTASSACGGHNSCKGKGFVKMSKQACKKIGGKVKS